MAYDPLVKEPEAVAPPATVAPDPATLINDRFAALERSISEQYRANKGLAPQVQYVPYPVAPQAAEAEITEADILADIPGSVQRMAEKVAAQREAALREELGTHLGAIYEKDFARDLKDLSAHPYFAHVGEQLKEHFAANPNDRYAQGALQRKFNELVGANLETIQRTTADAVERTRAVDHAIPVTASPLPAHSPKGEPEVKLDNIREFARQEFNRDFGLNMSAREWVDIESGKLLPSNRREQEASRGKED